MNKESIGVLEETVLLIVMREKEINGAEVLRQYVNLLNRSISLPAIISVLKRLEQKGFLTSVLGDATQERGGKRKRLYQATAEGVEIARSIQDNRNFLWSGMGLNWCLSGPTLYLTWTRIWEYPIGHRKCLNGYLTVWNVANQTSTLVAAYLYFPFCALLFLG